MTASTLEARASTIVSALLLGVAFAALPAAASHPDRIEDGTLTCTVSGSNVKLSWNVQFFAPIQGWIIVRDGAELTRLEPDAMGFLDASVEDGEHEYDLQAVNFDGSIGTLGFCRVVVGDFGIACEAQSDGAIRIAWEVLIDIEVFGFIIIRNGRFIASVPPDTMEYLDKEPDAGINRYVVHAEIHSGHTFIVGACTLRSEPSGFQCTVDGLEVRVDWSGVILPAIAFSHFDVFRDGALIAQTRATHHEDSPGRGLHHYLVIAVIDRTTDPATPSNLRVGECTVIVTGGEGPPPPRDLTCVVAIPAGRPIAAGDPTEILPGFWVFLSWVNSAPYDKILISRNGMPVASLPGNETGYTDHPPAFQGRFVYEVRGVLGNEASEPVSCEVVIGVPGPPPPEDFQCRVNPFILAPVNVVNLTWTNPVEYSGIIIERNGAELATLPGDALSYNDVGPPLTLLVYSIRGIGVDGTASEPVFCRIDLGGGHPPPVRDLHCEAVGTTAVLKWQNGAAYDAVAVERHNDGLTAVLPGDATSHEDAGLTPGVVYDYSVYGIFGRERSSPESCRVLIEGSPLRDLLFFSSSLQDPRALGDVPAINGPITCLARNAEAIQGWSFGVRNDPSQIVPKAAGIEDTSTARLNDGAGPTFIKMHIEREGITMAVVIDEEDPLDTLPPPDFAHSLAKIEYDLGPDGAPGIPYRIHYSETLGSPPVAVIFVVRGFEVRPSTLGGWVAVGRDGPRFLRADSNGDGIVDLTDAVHTLGWLFLGKEIPGCLEAADSNGSREVNIADPIHTLQALFSGGPPPPPPFPECGPGAAPLGCRTQGC